MTKNSEMTLETAQKPAKTLAFRAQPFCERDVSQSLSPVEQDRRSMIRLLSAQLAQRRLMIGWLSSWIGTW